ncbi:40892_t:CDS:2 [Gigaspora margarita]|uniref:40892_t:CDS:1 n=1 Tax=Gigaspora margarita TaxID=4874 RepID=A0ABN7VRE7_GIGMA|nr:40892_t:CDS:2 [Gigaspora margarita]
MSTITLSCLVVGENPYENVFEVDIDNNKTKVDISLKENKKLIVVNTKINANIKDKLDGVKLLPLSKISKHFTSQLANERIHIIIQHLFETKKVYCTATYGHKSKKFQWTVTHGQITLSALKSQLHTCFTFLDGTEDEHIVINREYGGKEKEIICLVDDKDLADVIWAQGFKRKSYFRYGHFLKSRHYSNIGHVLKNIAMKHKICIYITSANEATRREFISCILHGIASCYNGEVKVCPEYELSRSHGKGPVDWVIKIGDTIIVVTKAKREDINQKVTNSSNNCLSNFNSVTNQILESKQSEEMNTSLPKEEIPEGLPPSSKSSKKMEIDAFLDEAKKSGKETSNPRVSSNTEKKTSHNLNSAIQLCNRSYKKKRMNELKHELFNLLLESDTSSSINHNNVTDVFTSLQHLAQLCNKAIDAEDRANRKKFYISVSTGGISEISLMRLS